MSRQLSSGGFLHRWKLAASKGPRGIEPAAGLWKWIETIQLWLGRKGIYCKI